MPRDNRASIPRGRTTLPLTVATFATLAMTAVGCSGSTTGPRDDAAGTSTSTTTAAGGHDGHGSTSATDGTPPIGSHDGFPCTLLEIQVLRDIVGGDVSTGEVKKRYLTEDRTNYTASACTWTLSTDAPTARNIALQVSTSADFDGAEVQCLPLITGATPVADIADEAYWSWTNPGTDHTTGRLRVCTASDLITIQVDGISQEPTAMNAATTLAAAALSAL